VAKFIDIKKLQVSQHTSVLDASSENKITTC